MTSGRASSGGRARSAKHCRSKSEQDESKHGISMSEHGAEHGAEHEEHGAEHGAEHDADRSKFEGSKSWSLSSASISAHMRYSIGAF